MSRMVLQAKHATLVSESFLMGRLTRFHYPLSVFTGGMERLNELLAQVELSQEEIKAISYLSAEKGLMIQLQLSDGLKKFEIFPKPVDCDLPLSGAGDMPWNQ